MDLRTKRLTSPLHGGVSTSRLFRLVALLVVGFGIVCEPQAPPARLQGAWYRESEGVSRDNPYRITLLVSRASRESVLFVGVFDSVVAFEGVSETCESEVCEIRDSNGGSLIRVALLAQDRFRVIGTDVSDRVQCEESAPDLCWETIAAHVGHTFIRVPEAPCDEERFLCP